MESPQVERALKAIGIVFQNTRIPLEETLARLETLNDYLSERIVAVRADLDAIAKATGGNDDL